MNLRRTVLTGFVICLTLSFSSALFAQTTADKSVKNLRERLKKYSRLQFQDLTVYFRPLEFDSCKVSYQYQITENIGSGLTSSGNSSSPLDTYQQTRVERTTLRQTITGNYVNLPGRRNEITNLMNVNATSNASIITSFDFADLDASSLKIVKRSSGIYVFFQSVKSRDIEKESFTSENLTVNRGDVVQPLPTDTKNEYLPVVSEKKAEEIRALFSETIRQCKAN